jgi:hypothetical protein
MPTIPEDFRTPRTTPDVTLEPIETPPANTGTANTTTGLDRATEAGHLPSNAGLPVGGGGEGIHVTNPGLARTGLEEHVRARRPGAFDLIPGRYPDAVSLSFVLQQAAGDPRVELALRKVLADFKAATGIAVPAEVEQQILANPARILDALAVSPKQLSLGFDAIVELHGRGLIRDAEKKPAKLPQGFDLANLANAPIERPQYPMKELAPGLYQGDLPSDLPDARAKANIALAEAFDRLAENATKPEGERFKVRLGGREFTRLDTLVKALSDSGHEIEVVFRHRIANFANLKTKLPDGKFIDVPAAMLIKTGIRDPESQEEIALPAAHAEMVISVKSNENTRGPKVDGDVKFYQGMHATGFFADGVSAMPSWLGLRVTDRFQGKKALEAIELAGLLSDVINDVARERGLPFGAYGVTGVCMDTVEVLRHRMTGELQYWPLLMRDGLLSPEIERRLADGDRRDDPEYRRLLESMAAAPSDVQPNETARARMLSSIPWEAGREPFESIVRARQVLEA